MSCSRCDELCITVEIVSPGALAKAIEVIGQNIDDGTLAEIVPSDSDCKTAFESLRNAGPWPDIVFHRFRCTMCEKPFVLEAETYHGQGGVWAPENAGALK